MTSKLHHDLCFHFLFETLTPYPSFRIVADCPNAFYGSTSSSTTVTSSKPPCPFSCLPLPIRFTSLKSPTYVPFVIYPVHAVFFLSGSRLLQFILNRPGFVDFSVFGRKILSSSIYLLYAQLCFYLHIANPLLSPSFIYACNCSVSLSFCTRELSMEMIEP
ncbi:hypothetical protein BT96DRAFT_149196 [Gymnopus androsaceus JB14]|uniref:Uncharacterized protein n=1 Tax=Gymnopus androsaceus JB14 TaxID=1447944 RepID=A0A6A4IDG0_9AGAR|nr:hypothetical protein BT96DRAFT_149196 [Gymnopus androsaceus JB14]